MLESPFKKTNKLLSWIFIYDCIYFLSFIANLLESGPHSLYLRPHLFILHRCREVSPQLHWAVSNKATTDLLFGKFFSLSSALNLTFLQPLRWLTTLFFSNPFLASIMRLLFFSYLAIIPTRFPLQHSLYPPTPGAPHPLFCSALFPFPPTCSCPPFAHSP